MLKEYKIFAGNMIVESDNTKELKIQLLNFVKDAAESQVKSFILNGTIRENIKEDEVKDINEQFEAAWDKNKTHFAK
jgi:DNA-binding TFAR19-related protein (PDSD5 family)